MTGQNICHRTARKMWEYVLSILQELSSTAADAQTTQNEQLPRRSNKAWKGSDPKTMQPQTVLAAKQTGRWSQRGEKAGEERNRDSRAIASKSHFPACVTSHEDKLVLIQRQLGNCVSMVLSELLMFYSIHTCRAKGESHPLPLKQLLLHLKPTQ